MINIINSNDEHQRYKMPKLEISYQGKKFTILDNIKEISKSLHVKSDILCKFISIEKTTQCKKNKFNGLFELNDIEKIIFNFINDFVLCTKCGLPELKHKAHDGEILNKCLSCGHKFLTRKQHIVKRYWCNKHGKPFNVKKFKEQLSLVTEKKTAEDLEKKLDENYLVVQSIDYKSSFKKFINENHTKEEYYEKVKLLKLAFDLNDLKTTNMLFMLLDLNSYESFEKSFVEYSYLFKHFINNHIQFLNNFQSLLIQDSDIISKSYRVLNLFYDIDFFTEYDILCWYDTNDYNDIYNEFKKNSELFINWLKTAEYEDTYDEVVDYIDRLEI